MDIKNSTLYVNIDAGLLFETQSTLHKELKHCVGKKVKVEILEMDSLLVGDTYYTIVGWNGSLARIKPMNRRIRCLTVTLYFREGMDEQDIQERVGRGIDKMGYAVDDMIWSSKEEV